MKITIKDGTTYTDAIETLKIFLDENYATYPIISKNINIDFELKDTSGQACPDNKKEYLISGRAVTDAKQKELSDAIEEIMAELDLERQKIEMQLECVNRRIRLDESYLSTAEAKGRKSKKILQRRAELKKHLLNRKDYQEILKDYLYVISAAHDKKYSAREEVITIKEYGRKQKIYEVFLDFDLPEFSGTYSIIKGLQKKQLRYKMKE